MPGGTWDRSLYDSIQRSGCATTLIGTTRQRHLDSALAAAEEPIDEDLLADVLAAVGPDRAAIG